MKGFSWKHIALKVDVLKDRKIYCLLAHPCIFEPVNVTGWGSEGVKSCQCNNRNLLGQRTKPVYWSRALTGKELNEFTEVGLLTGDAFVLGCCIIKSWH